MTVHVASIDCVSLSNIYVGETTTADKPITSIDKQMKALDKIGYVDPSVNTVLLSLFLFN